MDLDKLHLPGIIISCFLLIISFMGIKPFNFDLAGVVIILCGLPIFVEGLKGLIEDKDITAGVLVIIAMIASVLIGEIFAAAEIAFIMSIGEFLEEYTVERTQKGFKRLVNLTPQKATIIKNGNEEVIEVKSIVKGNILKVLPGETIPTDGIIIKGNTSIDQSLLTGESVPVDKKEGEEVYAGTINSLGSIEIKAIAEGEDNSLQKLINLIDTAKPENAKIVKLADKWAKWIVIIAVVSSILTYIVTGDILRAVTILIVFCPCAFVIATPTAIMAALGNLTKYGILVKDGVSLEVLANIKNILLDKTGTITYGNPKLVKINPKNISEDELIRLVASLENNSEHPLAKSIVKYYKDNYLEELYEVDNFQMFLAQGVIGEINSSLIKCGNKKFLNLDLSQNQDEIALYVEKDNEIIGELLLSDVVRKDSKRVISKLKEMDLNIHLLTGDNEKTGLKIANEVGITNVKTECYPEDKLNYIKQLQLNDETVVMVGDGINDAPSLKKADIGIAMGKIGSDIASDAANIVLINDNIKDLPQLIGLSRKTFNTIKLNLIFAFSLNLFAMILAIFGLIGPVIGAILHNVGSVLVIINSALLLKYINN